MQNSKNLIRFFIIFLLLILVSENLDAKKKKRNYKKYKKSYHFNKKYKVHYPKDYKIGKAALQQVKGDSILVNLYSKSFSQGDIIYVEIQNMKKSETNFVLNKIVFNNNNYKFTGHEFGYRSFVPIDGNIKPGTYSIDIFYKIDGTEKKLDYKFEINNSNFVYNKKPLDLGKYSNVDYQETPENLAFIERCTIKKKKVFSRNNSNMITNEIAHPRDYHYVTSPFWAKRTIMQYKIDEKKKVRLKNRVKVHRGVDLRGEIGESVHSIAHGKVVLAEEMFYEGNMVVIDHGNKIFSYYMHLHKLNVSEGNNVKAGEVIGQVGSTGVSTAAHLHVSFMVQGVQVHPLSVLGLPIRN